jgi:tungstate transport system substrate-binding protein
MTRSTLHLVICCAVQVACARGSNATPLRLGTTTTVEQSGALRLLDSLRPPVAVRVVIGPSGTILGSAASGDLDIAITHAPALEQRLLIEPGHAALRCPFVASAFAIVGPTGDAADVRGASSAADAFHRIATRHAVFISRADSSGTHIKELSLWKAAGVGIPGVHDRWYVQAGVDQSATLRIADERSGYALADLPTFAKLANVDLKVLFTADSALGNPYTLYVIRSASNDSGGKATRFSQWALEEWRARLIAERLPGGLAAFQLSPGECAVPTAVVNGGR